MVELANSLVRGKLEDLGINIDANIDIDRIYIVPRKSDEFSGIYCPNSNEIFIKSEQKKRWDKIKDMVVPGNRSIKDVYSEDYFMKTLVHEIIHFYQETAYAQREDASFDVVQQSFTQCDKDENLDRREMFNGMMEFGTELLATRVLEGSTQEREKIMKRVIQRPENILKDHIYAIKYGSIVTEIMEFFGEKYGMDKDEIEKTFFQSLMKGEVDRKYVRDFVQEYGKGALRVLSYVGSRAIEEYGQKVNEKASVFFAGKTSNKERQQILLEIEGEMERIRAEDK